VRLYSSDFKDYELPAVQLWDRKQNIKHLASRKEVDWEITLELLMKTTTAGVVTQTDLWDLHRLIELALFDEPNLGIPGVFHMIYQSSDTDLHSLDPMYVCRMNIAVRFNDSLTGDC
jgi:hypothetical protein